MKNKNYILIGIASLLAIIFFVFSFIMPIYNRDTIGIIGGADGPTAIYLAQSKGSLTYLNIILVIVATAILYRFIKKIINR